jgi:hypothetical protein
LTCLTLLASYLDTKPSPAHSTGPSQGRYPVGRALRIRHGMVVQSSLTRCTERNTMTTRAAQKQLLLTRGAGVLGRLQARGPYSNQFRCITFDDLVKSRHPVEKRGPAVFKCLRRLDSGFRRNDGKNAFPAFYETITFRSPKNLPADDASACLKLPGGCFT